MFTVCITAQEDGQYRVYVEQAAPEGEALPMPDGQPAPMEPEMAPEAAEPAEPGAQTVDSVKAALTIALMALKNNGKMTEDEDQLAGFNSTPGA